MTIETFTYLIGYNGFIPQYCTIQVPQNLPKINSFDCTIPENLNDFIKKQAYFKVKAKNLLGIPQKRSENYEGVNEKHKR